MRHRALIRGFTVAPADITRQLGIRPTRTFVAGKPFIKGSSRIAKCSGWVLETRERTFDTAAMNTVAESDLDALVARLFKRRSVLLTLLPPGSLSFLTIISTDSINPCFGISLETSRQITELQGTWSLSIWTSLCEK